MINAKPNGNRKVSSSTNKDLESVVLCHSCDVVVSKRSLPVNVRALCPRCHTALYHAPFCTVNGLLALCITSLILLIPANYFPILELHFLGSVRTSTVFEGAYAVLSQGFFIVGVAVILAAIVAPLLFVLSILTQTLIIKFAIDNRLARSTFRFLLKKHNLIKQFSMPEIYIISLLVTSFNLGDFADVYFGIGTFCYTMLFITMIFMQREYDIEHMWGHLHD